MKPYQRLGISDGMIAVDGRIEGYQQSLNFIPHAGGRHASARAMFIARDAAHIAACYYLLDEPAPQQTWEFARLAVHNTIEENFYGAWRSQSETTGGPPVDPPYRDNWVTEYRYGITWASVLDDWDSARRMSEYPQDDGEDQSDRKSEIPWYLLLADVLKQASPGGRTPRASAAADQSSRVQLPNPEPPEPNGIWLTPELQLKPATCEELIEHGSKKRIKLLATVLSEILRKDAAAADRAFAEYMKYFKKTEYPRARTPDDKLALDGTILFHLARHRGIALTIKSEHSDHIIRRLK
ncbi:MAG: hypothetical protein QM754_18070 [Tepidisphaeraceae bacterium]